MTEKNRIIGIIDGLIDASVAYSKNKKDGSISISPQILFNLDSEINEELWINSVRVLIPMRNFGCFSKFYPNKMTYDFFGLNTNKLKKYKILIEKDLSPQEYGRISIIPGLPDKFQWEDVTMESIDGNNMEVKIDCDPNFKYILFYKDLGCENKTNLKPDVQWILLETLFKSNGEISYNIGNDFKEAKKRKQILSKRLQLCFGISDDPFYKYTREDGYKTRFRFVKKIEYDPTLEDGLHD